MSFLSLPSAHLNVDIKHLFINFPDHLVHKKNRTTFLKKVIVVEDITVISAKESVAKG